jgi:hypothetical protein
MDVVINSSASLQSVSEPIYHSNVEHLIHPTSSDGREGLFGKPRRPSPPLDV